MWRSLVVPLPEGVLGKETVFVKGLYNQKTRGRCRIVLSLFTVEVKGKHVVFLGFIFGQRQRNKWPSLEQLLLHPTLQINGINLILIWYLSTFRTSTIQFQNKLEFIWGNPAPCSIGEVFPNLFFGRSELGHSLEIRVGKGDALPVARRSGSLCWGGKKVCWSADVWWHN